MQFLLRGDGELARGFVHLLYQFSIGNFHYMADRLKDFLHNNRY
jgi:hypothetical protein